MFHFSLLCNCYILCNCVYVPYSYCPFIMKGYWVVSIYLPLWKKEQWTWLSRYILIVKYEVLRAYVKDCCRLTYGIFWRILYPDFHPEYTSLKSYLWRMETSLSYTLSSISCQFFSQFWPFLTEVRQKLLTLHFYDC